MNILNDFLAHVKENCMVVNYISVKSEGKVLAEYNRLPTKTRFNIMSASKSFVSIAAGIALDEGLITLDEKICDSFPEYLSENPGENLPKITVRHLLTMTGGTANALFFNDDPERYVTEDWIRHFFSADFTYNPGERFLYSNFNTYMVSCLIEKKAGTGLVSFLKKRFFDPLEIYSPDWTCCPKGHVHAANGLYLTIDEFSRFGDMLLQEGAYGGRRIVSEAYLKEATRDQLPNLDVNYGYQFWINPDGKSYRADGKLGNYCIVMPDRNAVVTVMACEGGNLFPLVWDDICLKL